MYVLHLDEEAMTKIQWFIVKVEQEGGEKHNYYLEFLDEKRHIARINTWNNQYFYLSPCKQ